MKLKFGIITAGNIAAQMAQTLVQMHSEGIICHAVAAREEARAISFAKKYGFLYAYGSYDQLYRDKEVDIIYIGSPHSHHFEQTRQALLHNKHVLCEKPLTVNAAQAANLFALAKERGLLLAEATWTRYMPFVPLLQRLMNNGEIGAPQTLMCSFGFPVSNRARMAQPQLAGGALLDLGIYPLTMAAIAFGSRVSALQGVCTKTPLGVDASLSVSMAFEGGQTAALSASMMCLMENAAVIAGTKGTIHIPSFWRADRLIITDESGAEQVHAAPHDFTGYEHEVRSVQRALSQGLLECPELPHKESLRILEQMDALRRLWQLSYPCEAV